VGLGRDGVNGLWETEQFLLIFNIGTEWIEVCTLALKDFVAHAYTLYCILLYNIVYIFLLCKLKISLFLGCYHGCREV
jgi:hypothetical protein